MSPSNDVLDLIERFVLWLGVGSLLLLALRAAALLVALGREVLNTYKTILEIREFLARAKERERIVMEPLRKDIDRLNREQRETWRTGLRAEPDRIDPVKQNVDELMSLLRCRLQETRMEIDRTVVKCLEELNLSRRPRLFGIAVTDKVLLFAAVVFLGVYISIRIAPVLRHTPGP